MPDPDPALTRLEQVRLHAHHLLTTMALWGAMPLTRYTFDEALLAAMHLPASVSAEYAEHLLADDARTVARRWYAQMGGHPEGPCDIDRVEAALSAHPLIVRPTPCGGTD